MQLTTNKQIASQIHRAIQGSETIKAEPRSNMKDMDADGDKEHSNSEGRITNHESWVWSMRTDSDLPVRAVIRAFSFENTQSTAAANSDIDPCPPRVFDRNTSTKKVLPRERCFPLSLS